jgi:PIG-P
MKQRVKPRIAASHVSEDTDLDEPTSPANPIAPFPPLTHKTLSSLSRLKPATRASGGRAPEFYGFVAWLVTLLSYVLFLLWALVPDKVTYGLGIHWYPARWGSEPSSATVLTLLCQGVGTITSSVVRCRLLAGVLELHRTGNLWDSALE